MDLVADEPDALPHVLVRLGQARGQHQEGRALLGAGTTVHAREPLEERVAVLARPEPGRIVLLGPDGLAVELEPLGHAWRVLWSSDHARIPGAEILDPRALEATARAMVA